MRFADEIGKYCREVEYRGGKVLQWWHGSSGNGNVRLSQLLMSFLCIIVVVSARITVVAWVGPALLITVTAHPNVKKNWGTRGPSCAKKNSAIPLPRPLPLWGGGYCLPTLHPLQHLSIWHLPPPLSFYNLTTWCSDVMRLNIRVLYVCICCCVRLPTHIAAHWREFPAIVTDGVLSHCTQNLRAWRTRWYDNVLYSVKLTCLKDSVVWQCVVFC